jgi:hypothetical protein
MTNGTTAAMNRGAGLLAEQKSAVRVIDPAMSCGTAMTMMTRLGTGSSRGSHDLTPPRWP